MLRLNRTPDRADIRRVEPPKGRPVGIIAFIFVGAIAGYLGRLIMPGRQQMGCLGTTLLGMAGSLVGGTLAALIFEGDLDISASGIIGAIIGTLIMLFVLERTGKI